MKKRKGGGVKVVGAHPAVGAVRAVMHDHIPASSSPYLRAHNSAGDCTPASLFITLFNDAESSPELIFHVYAIYYNYKEVTVALAVLFLTSNQF